LFVCYFLKQHCDTLHVLYQLISTHCITITEHPQRIDVDGTTAALLNDYSVRDALVGWWAAPI